MTALSTNISMMCTSATTLLLIALSTSTFLLLPTVVLSNIDQLTCPPSFSGFLAGPGCVSYYICSNGLVASSELTNCMEGTLFNEAMSLCDHAANVECDTTAFPTERPTKKPTVAPTPRIAPTVSLLFDWLYYYCSFTYQLNTNGSYVRLQLLLCRLRRDHLLPMWVWRTHYRLLSMISTTRSSCMNQATRVDGFRLQYTDMIHLLKDCRLCILKEWVI